MNTNFQFSKTFFFLIFIFLFAGFSFAQKNSEITGTIYDSSTGQPIPHAEIFISGTTSGCISDNNGKFNLIVPFFPCTLVADHVSYHSFTMVLHDKNNPLNLRLNPSVFSIDEIEVKSKSKRKKNLRYFYSHFINDKRKTIEIANDSVLRFHRNPMKFTAETVEPLVIINHYLGYKIKVILEEFSVIMTDGPTGKQLPLYSMEGGEIMQVTGHYFYENLEVESKEKQKEFEKNRKLSYYGSYRHFLKSIYHNNPEEQGYEIKVFPKTEGAGFAEIEHSVSLPNRREFRINADSLLVNYYFDEKKNPIPLEYLSNRYYLYKHKSIIYPTPEPFFIRENGTSPKLTFVIDGLMVFQSFAHSLPEDYEPDN